MNNVLQEECVTLLIDLQKLLTNTWKNMIEIENHHILNFGIGWAMPQKLPVNNFERVRDTSKFNETFIQKYNETSGERNFLDIVVQCLEKGDEDCS